MEKHPFDSKISNKYLTTPVKRLAVDIGKSEGYIKRRLNYLGLEIPPEVIKQRKIDSRIKKGGEAFNKGKKQDEYMAQDSIDRTKLTRFKHGDRPVTAHPVGHIYSMPDKSGRAYQYISVKKGRPKLLHQHVWIEANGPIPKGFIVRFIDGDTMNCKLENLECISRSENMNRNSYHRYGKDIAGLIQLKGALNRQINKQSKKYK